jgi:UDP-glucose 6-dehydrogenase
MITEDRGFGGHCFPKDTKAFVKSAERMDVEFTLLKEALKYNNNIRKDNV